MTGYVVIARNEVMRLRATDRIAPTKGAMVGVFLGDSSPPAGDQNDGGRIGGLKRENSMCKICNS